MNSLQILDRDLERIAWGMFFIWWGMSELFKFPEGLDVAVIGLILLGLNVARSLSGLSTSGFTITLGLLALVWGVLELTRAILLLPFELPVFAILLIVLGVIFLVGEYRHFRAAGPA